MSPRSQEFMAEARARLGAAHATLDAGYASASISAAYYAMLYAARAALSEEDRYAKTHKGSWDLFQETFVATGRFEADLAGRARRLKPRREAADYDAAPVDREEAAGTLALAERFVDAVAGMLDA